VAFENSLTDHHSEEFKEIAEVRLTLCRQDIREYLPLSIFREEAVLRVEDGFSKLGDKFFEEASAIDAIFNLE